MTTTTAGYLVPDPSHDFTLDDGTTKYGFIYQRNIQDALQEIPLSAPVQPFEIQQNTFVGGRGRLRYQDDPTGFYDSNCWTMTDGKILPPLQWRFATGIRTADENMPGDNSTFSWWKLYGNTPASDIARYLCTAFNAGTSYDADKCHLIIRRRGTPGTLTFKLCDDGTGKPGTVLQTVTKTTSDLGQNQEAYLAFNWTGTEALTAAALYYLEISGASTDDADDHWEILCESVGIAKYSADEITWANANVNPYYRVTNGNLNRNWFMFLLDGAMYAVDQRDSGDNSVLKTNGVRGTATGATSTTLVDSGLSMTVDEYIGAYIRIVDGKGDGQVRQITDNDATSFTVAEWDTTPDTTSRYVVYGTGIFTTTTGTPGLGAVKSRPAVAGKIAYFPQGGAANIRRMRVNGTSHDFADDGTNKGTHVYVSSIDPTKILVHIGNAATAVDKTSPVKTWGSDLVLSTGTTIGTSDYRITNYLDYHTLYIFKEDGPYTLQGGKVKKVGLGFSDVPDPTNGVAACVQDLYLWFGWAHSIERMQGQSASDLLNWKQGYDGMPDDRRGVISAATSAAGWAFFAIDGRGTDYSSVIAWNGMAWHEVFRGWVKGARIRNVFWQPCSETRGKLWISIAGELVYIDFPLDAANPTKDSSLNYSWGGEYITSTFDANDPLLYKLFHLLRLELEQGTVEVDYQTGTDIGSSTWTYLASASTSPATDISVNVGSQFAIRFRIRFMITNTRTPAIVQSLMLEGRKMPEAKYQWVVNTVYDGTPDAESKEGDMDDPAGTKYSKLITWAEQQTKLTMRSNSQSMDNKVVTLSLPSKRLQWINDEGAGGVTQFVMLEA